MKLTVKDRLFLERLKDLYEKKNLDICLMYGDRPCFVLRKNYGDRIESHFRMTRQGVRWRFQRLFSHVYVEAYEVIYWIESSFGTSLRKDAIALVKHRVEMRRKLNKMGET